MSDLSSGSGSKRKSTMNSSSEPQPKSSKATFLSPSLLLLEIPADTNTSLPVWEAMRSQQVDIGWTVNPYGISVHLTPMTAKQGKTKSSSKNESASNIVQAVPLAPSILQPQMIIQAIAQQHGASQNNSCVLLTFAQNNGQALPVAIPASQPQKTPQSSTTASSLFVSLPHIVTQPQSTFHPSTPVKNRVPPAIQTPTSTPVKAETPTKTPAPSPFHTKNSSNIQICDSFLLSLCQAGKKCKMHHTLYPFHWQLWCVTTHQWVNFPPRSQILLERMYCDVSQTTVCIRDRDDCYNLSLDSMDLDSPTKYDGVRRLTNSESLVKNPYFPSKWLIYWWNNLNWEEYHKHVSKLLLDKMNKKEYECSFYIGSQEYKVDFTTMTQTNVTTGFQRKVRCRPMYRSPDSMKPYLQTGIQADPTEPVSEPPGVNFSVNPLEDFSSWYPPVWCLASEQDYSLADVPANTQAYRSIQNLFYESLPETKVDIISIQQVQNLLHWDKYQRHKAFMQKHTRSKEPLERHLFHGTTKEASEDICHNNFDPRLAGVNGASYGYGTYFATSASFSNTYSAKAGADDVRHMFLAKVLVGKASVGKCNYRRPPPLSSKTRQCRLYDTCVDSVNNPTMFVVFDNCQCYPYYLIKYKDLPKEVDI